MDDPIDQRLVRQPTAFCRAREFAFTLQIAVRVDLDDVDLSRVGHTQIDAPVVAEPERIERLDRDTLHPLDELGVQVAREDRFRSSVLRARSFTIVSPLRLPALDARLAGR